MNGALSRREFVEKGSTAAAIFSAASLGMLATAWAATITWCAVYSPPGFEQFFREVGVVPGNGSAAPSADRVREVASKYGMILRS